MIASRHNLVLDTKQRDQHLILNPLSGAMDIFDTRAIGVLSHADNLEAQKAWPDFFDYCKHQGYVFESQSEEIALLDQLRHRAERIYRAEPLRVQIYPTFLCNLRCTYCFQDHQMHGRADLVQPKMIDAMFDAIAFFRDLYDKTHAPLLTLFGGEPLLDRSRQRHAIERILGLAKEHEYRVKIITNGIHLGSYADMLSTYPIEYVQVTLDGPREAHDRRRVFAGGKGTFDRIVGSIDSAVERSLPVVVRVNIDSENIPLLPGLARFIIHKGWLDRGVAVSVSPVDEFVPESECCSGQAKIDTLKRLLDVKKAHPDTAFMSVSYRLAHYFEYILENGILPFPTVRYCPATMGNQIALDCEGNVFSCCCMNSCETGEFRLGSFYPAVRINEDLLSAWWHRDVMNLPACRDCSLALLCGGGCTKLALTTGGDLRRDVVCPPMVNSKDVSALLDYYLPDILEAQRQRSGTAGRATTRGVVGDRKPGAACCDI